MSAAPCAATTAPFAAEGRAILDRVAAHDTAALGQRGPATHLLNALARLGDPAAALGRLHDLASTPDRDHRP